MVQVPAEHEQRVCLFLQGPPSNFVRLLGDEIELLGAKVHRINLCAGDWISWHDHRSQNYKGTLDEWPQWLRDFCKREKVTDIIYYADRVPYHVAAHEVAQSLGIDCYAFEFGYLRPDWITLERNGMSVHSLFPKDPDVIRASAEGLPNADRVSRYAHEFHQEAFFEVIYNLANVFYAWTFWGYDRDRFYHPVPEYLGHLRRLVFGSYRDWHAHRTIEQLITRGAPYYVFPLQLQSDYQLRYNSQYNHIAEAAEEVIRSFAKSADVDAQLVFKIHPLDNGLEPWRRILMTIAKRFGVKRRVHVIDGGNLNQLLEHSAGALTINSTTGLHSLRVGCPTKVLGIALYDIEGLTCQLPIDDFWRKGTKPDNDLLLSLERLLAATIQVKGNFYNFKGRRLGAYRMARRIMERTVNLPGALCEEPPRIAIAREHAIPVTFADQMAKRGTTERWTYAWRK